MAKITYPTAWGLTALEASYLTALRPGKIVSEADLANLHAGPLSPASRRVSKTMRQLRVKLDPFDIEIETKWGQGWRLGQAGRAKLTGLLTP